MVKVKKQKVRPKKKVTNRQPSRISFKAQAKFILMALVLCVIGISLVRFKYMLLDSQYFMVKDMQVKVYEGGAFVREFSIEELGGESIVDSNIFFVDIDLLKERIELAHPEFKDVVLRRLLPNRLIVETELRKAVAQVRSDRYYLIDGEAVILPDPQNFSYPDLPIIIGIGVSLAKVSPANLNKFESERLDSALDLIDKIALNQDFSGYSLKTVDIADQGNITFYFEGLNVEMKIGRSDFSNRLSLLATVLGQLGSDVDDFRYIDLRFEDPIIGPR
ncbi:MAG: cell division protein FtsQ/DivIB [Candidatus Omnitrophica bacterium]|nr:cell division protein FtsQ/DivIB [Candidatus Omnitrophota bacterium]